MLSSLTNFAQTTYDSYTTTTTTTTGDTASAGAVLMVLSFTYFIMFVFYVIPAIITMWKLFVKAGKPGWAAIVPIYNNMVLAEIAGKEAWWGLLPLIPLVGFIFGIIIIIEAAKRFKNGVAIFITFMFIPIVSVFLVGKTEYTGGSSDNKSAPVPPQTPSTTE